MAGCAGARRCPRLIACRIEPLPDVRQFHCGSCCLAVGSLLALDLILANVTPMQHVTHLGYALPDAGPERGR